MRIAYVCSDFGVEIHGPTAAAARIRGLSRALGRQGHEVVIFAPRRGGEAPAGFDVEVCELDLAAPEERVFELLREDPDAGAAAAREIRALLYGAALRYRLHGILGVFRPDAVYERYSLLGSGGQTIARGLGVPLVLEVAGPLTDAARADRELAFGKTARALERAVLCEADRVVAVSRPLAAQVEELGVPAERIAVLVGGVEAERFEVDEAGRAAARTELGIGPEEPVVGVVGSPRPWPGLATAVRAVGALARRGPAPRLLLAGAGPDRADLAALLEAEGLAAAAVVGAPAEERWPGLLAAMDVAVVAHDPVDGPLRLLEAMAAGRPVVTVSGGSQGSRAGEAVRDGVTGLLYPAGNPAALAEAIAAPLTDRAWAAALGRAARADVRARRTWDGAARAVVGIIDGARSRPPLEAAGVGAWG